MADALGMKILPCEWSFIVRVEKIIHEYDIYIVRKVSGGQDSWFPNDVVAQHAVIKQQIAK